ncbi:DUF1707 SHOCT-like domain-containing protein [Rhodococcoides corynebacterioides]|uniref:DUF1707 SHOCT-like domain-containing protein n=1 Tax=Rhodococcoides corynebacterioides TaxID=53972 RepID=UPI00083372AE|nr:DUF1707 domain-containing protein [Rhodococcus corynebacterioides]MBY6349480.1 DUF1707 domain-containing protein [Rhodococcus corynebacterioides]MBY6362612.1 DUF1707 domain-containing protein [Rhodococcus corynebacterioides]
MDDRDLRVSDAERNHVGELLQRAVGQGMLSLGEYTERMDTALAAKTRGELNAVLVDLPGIRITESTAPESISRGSVVSSVGGADEVTVKATFSSVTRSGAWEVPRLLRVRSRMGSVTLNFVDATVHSSTVVIDVDDYLSSVSIIVPEGVSVNMDGLHAVAGSADNKVRGRREDSSLHLEIRGRTRMGSVTAKHPFGVTIKRMLG